VALADPLPELVLPELVLPGPVLPDPLSAPGDGLAQ
jgi:hypothetical protein